ncbi:MAG: tetratricopeptide repeat protein [Ignavibacteriales bacterium]|nr:tetratricopeptide repeat protein [Ignavibacteriales bacterium]
MKVKPIYIYLVIFAAFVIGVVIFSSTGGSEKEASGTMPNDEIHKGISGDGSESPSKSNVMETAKKKLEELKIAYEKNPDDTLKAREYADMLTMAHRSDKAIELYQKILKVDAKRIDAMIQLTFLFYNKGDLDKAEEHTNMVLKIDKNHQLGLFNLGAVAQAKGDNAKAKKIWQDIIKKFPQSEVARIAEESIKQLEAVNQK